MIREILKGPSEKLTTVCQETEPGESAKNTLVDMVETMVQSGGVGLAANQIGENIRALVAHDRKGGTVYAILNPRISQRSGIKIPSEEGCLSYPGRIFKKKRAWSCTVKGVSGDGHPIEVKAKGELSVIFQHEMDHLNGISIA